MGAKDKEDGWTALIAAVYFGKHKVVEELLRWEADTKAVDERSWTALKWAEDKGHTNIVKILKRAGATRRRLALGELPVATLLVFGAGSLLLLGYLLHRFNTSKRRPVDTDLTDLESGLAP